jgi:hypothetical protein
VIAKVVRRVTQSRLVAAGSDADTHQPVDHGRFFVTPLSCRTQILFRAKQIAGARMGDGQEQKVFSSHGGKLGLEIGLLVEGYVMASAESREARGKQDAEPAPMAPSLP